MKIGIVGEHIENDSKPMRILLEKKYTKEQCQFIPILKGVKGDQLENIRKTSGLINVEKASKKLDFIIFLRDLDALPSNAQKSKEKNDWFTKINKATGNDGTFFLIIYELEAIIYSNIETFNKKYKTKLTLKGSPLFLEDPKGKLIAASLGKNQYKESHAQEIFKELSFDEVYKNHKHKQHPCFQSFILELDSRLN